MSRNAVLPATSSGEVGSKLTEGARRRRRSALAIAALLLSAVVLALLLPGTMRKYRLAQARKCLAAGNAEQALVLLGSGDASECHAAERAFVTGVALRRADLLRESEAWFSRAVELGWPIKEVRPQQLMAAFQAGDPAAEAELKAMLLKPLDDDLAEELFDALAKGYFGRYSLIRAMSVLEHWITWRPRDPRPRHFRAVLLGLQGDLDAQIEDYRSIIEAAPDDFSAHALLADALTKRNDVDQALANYRWCSEHAPGDPLASLGIAVCLRRKGRYEEAAQELAAVIERGVPEKSRGRLLSELGELALELGQFSNAVDYLAKAIELLPLDGTARYSYGMALARTGNKEAAQAQMELAERFNRRQERLFELEHEIANQPKDPDLRYEAAMLLKEEGMAQESQTLLLTVLKADPTHARAHAALADLYAAQGKNELAETHRASADHLRLSQRALIESSPSAD